jgi:hypothetical protein
MVLKIVYGTLQFVPENNSSPPAIDVPPSIASVGQLLTQMLGAMLKLRVLFLVTTLRLLI